MQKLICELEQLKDSDTGKIIESKMKEFSELGKKSSDELFKELCFCLLTANFSALGGIKIQKEIGDGFFSLSEQELARKLAELGHRFPNARAKFISEARKFKGNLKEILSEIKNEQLMRGWLVNNIKGLGFKESSHFLRNIGYRNLAIIDFHIIDVLVKSNLIEQPESKSLTKSKYLEIENILKQIADKTNLPLGELDMYLWYMGTGKILK
jgi:N-glycosylase/DNA lyase